MANPELKEITKSRYLDAWTVTSFGGVIDELGTEEPWILRINKTPTIGSNVTIPNNISLQWEGDSLLNINSGIIVNGPPPEDHPNRLLFTGAGQYRIVKHPAFKYVDAIWYIPDGTGSAATITPAMSEAMRYGPFNNLGGGVLFPVGEYEIDHFWLLQRGWVAGRSMDPNVNGTMITRTGSLAGGEGQASVFRFLAGGRSMEIRNLVLQSDVATTAAMLARGDGSTDQNIVGIIVDNVTVNGCSESFRIHDTHANENWQVHKVEIRQNCEFLGPTVAGYRVNSINAGVTMEASVKPASNGTAVKVWIETSGKSHFNCEGRGQVAESLPGNPPAGIVFEFDPGDVNTGANSITAAEADDIPTLAQLYLSNSGGALPAGLSTATKYYWNADNNTLHVRPSEAAAGTSPVDITGQGTGTHKVWCDTPNPNVTPDQPFACYKITGPTSEGVTIGGGIQRDEGIPWFIWAEDFTDYSAPINLIAVQTQALIMLDHANIQLNLFGGTFIPGSFKDTIGTAARVKNFGARPYTYGVGGPINNYAGYAVPSPYRLDAFIGSSSFERGDDRARGTTYAVNANDYPIMGWEKTDAESTNILSLIMQRIGSGVKAGWWYLKNSMSGVADAQAGLYTDGGLGHSGRYLNARGDAATVSGGEITINCQLGVYHNATPTENATIEFSNPNEEFNHPICLRIKTSGTTSYDLTAGTNVVMLGTFATGTTSGALFSIWFDYDKDEEKWIETGRAAGTGTIENAQDSGSDLQLDNDALITSAYHGGSIGFHQDTTQKAIRITPDSPGALTKGYVKVMNVTNGGNEDFKMQLVPEADGDAIIDAYQSDILFQLSGSTAMKVDETISAGETRLLIYDVDNGTLERVTVGAPDSGGSGFKVLRIPN